MKIFVYEHFACGGAVGPLLEEGRAILRAVMRSFARLAGVEAFTIDGGCETFERAISSCGAALIIAPETEGVLENYVRKVEAAGKINLGCSPSAIHATGDKLKFSRVMEKAGIAHPETVTVTGVFDSSKFFPGEWILKPADGAGSEGLVVFGRPKTVELPLGSYVAQEFIHGEPMSLSIVSGADWLAILSVNRQRFRDGIIYDGGEITAREPDEALVKMARGIYSAIPGLRGYWGVDFVMTPNGPVAIEVNPRLTTSVCGLVDAVDPTPAEFILASINGHEPQIKSRRAVYFTKTGRHGRCENSRP